MLVAYDGSQSSRIITLQLSIVDGKRNIVADFLSRIPAEDFQNTMKEDSVIISPGDISLIF